MVVTSDISDPVEVVHQPPNAIDSVQARKALERYILQQAQAEWVAIESLTRLSGGAIQENWALDVKLAGGHYSGTQQWVLRTDAPSAVALSLSRAQEFAVLRVAFEAGVVVPRPLLLCSDTQVAGREFFIMQRIPGVAAGFRLTRNQELIPDPVSLAESLGENLARLHAIAPPCAALDFLAKPYSHHALGSIADYRRYLDTIVDAYPGLEWGLRWCELNAPDQAQPVLIHRDYRTGNYMVDHGRLTGVLDWEFTAWGDAREDVGWFLAKCWRFSFDENEAGGIGKAADFLRGYSNVSGKTFSTEELVYWQIMAHLRWAIIALQQAQRHLSGQQASLELALTGRLIPELELEILNLTSRGYDD